MQQQSNKANVKINIGELLFFNFLNKKQLRISRKPT